MDGVRRQDQHPIDADLSPFDSPYSHKVYMKTILNLFLVDPVIDSKPFAVSRSIPTNILPSDLPQTYPNDQSIKYCQEHPKRLMKNLMLGIFPIKDFIGGLHLRFSTITPIKHIKALLTASATKLNSRRESANIVSNAAQYSVLINSFCNHHFWTVES
ncbi:hypothetical protein Tco_1124183 [Tanacetum coccineum]|uniref:Uncharacterized protein n=1 Tax=Tanacetum coccineum TaxID=301880 RepID=A0ABQ5J887_9ASTR